MPFKTTHLTLHVTIRVDPSNIEPFLEALRPCWAGCFSEPECIFFEVTHDAANPGTFRFVETWTKDREWFEKYQLTKEYYGPYEEKTKPMWLAPRELEFFESVEGWRVVKEGYLDGAKREEGKV